MKKAICALLMGSLLTAGCTTPGKKTAIGAGVGAAVGAGVGALAGKKGSKGKAALFGAAAGAIVGGAIGNRLDRQAKDLAKVADARRVDQGILVSLKNDILFDTGRSALKSEAKEQLNQIAAVVVKYPDDHVVVAGHTDSVGTEAANSDLSQSRANAVKLYLQSQGVPSENIEAVGLGEGAPVASNDTAAGRSKNRRVELQITIPE